MRCSSQAVPTSATDGLAALRVRTDEQGFTLSDLLAIEREHISRGGRVGAPSSHEPSLEEMRELHDRMVAQREAGLTEDWEAIARAKKLRAASTDVASERALMLQRMAMSNPAKLRQHGTAVQVIHEQPPPQQAPLSPRDAVGAPSRTVGTASYSASHARALPSGFRRALQHAHSCGGRLSAVSIPSPGGSSLHDAQGHLDGLRRQASTPSDPFSMLDPIFYHAATTRQYHQRAAEYDEYEAPEAALSRYATRPPTAASGYATRPPTAASGYATRPPTSGGSGRGGATDPSAYAPCARTGLLPSSRPFTDMRPFTSPEAAEYGYGGGSPPASPPRRSTTAVGGVRASTPHASGCLGRLARAASAAALAAGGGGGALAGVGAAGMGAAGRPVWQRLSHSKALAARLQRMHAEVELPPQRPRRANTAGPASPSTTRPRQRSTTAGRSSPPKVPTPGALNPRAASAGGVGLGGGGSAGGYDSGRGGYAGGYDSGRGGGLRPPSDPSALYGSRTASQPALYTQGRCSTPVHPNGHACAPLAPATLQCATTTHPAARPATDGNSAGGGTDAAACAVASVGNVSRRSASAASLPSRPPSRTADRRAQEPHAAIVEADDNRSGGLTPPPNSRPRTPHGRHDGRQGSALRRAAPLEFGLEFGSPRPSSATAADEGERVLPLSGLPRGALPQPVGAVVVPAAGRGVAEDGEEAFPPPQPLPFAPLSAAPPRAAAARDERPPGARSGAPPGVPPGIGAMGWGWSGSDCPPAAGTASLKAGASSSAASLLSSRPAGALPAGGLGPLGSSQSCLGLANPSIASVWHPANAGERPARHSAAPAPYVPRMPASCAALAPHARTRRAERPAQHQPWGAEAAAAAAAAAAAVEAAGSSSGAEYAAWQCTHGGAVQQWLQPERQAPSKPWALDHLAGAIAADLAHLRNGAQYGASAHDGARTQDGAGARGGGSMVRRDSPPRCGSPPRAAQYEAGLWQYEAGGMAAGTPGSALGAGASGGLAASRGELSAPSIPASRPGTSPPVALIMTAHGARPATPSHATPAAPALSHKQPQEITGSACPPRGRPVSLDT